MQSLCYNLLLKDWFKCKLSYSKNVYIPQVMDEHSDGGNAPCQLQLIPHTALPQPKASISPASIKTLRKPLEQGGVILRQGCWVAGNAAIRPDLCRCLVCSDSANCTWEAQGIEKDSPGYWRDGPRCNRSLITAPRVWDLAGIPLHSDVFWCKGQLFGHSLPRIAKNKLETAVIKCKSPKLGKFKDQKKCFHGQTLAFRFCWKQNSGRIDRGQDR